MMQNAREAGGRPLLGILLVMLATLVFAVADTLTKHLAMLYPVPVVVAVRYLVNVVLLAVFLGPRMGARLWRTNRTALVAVRGLCLAAASLTMALALRVMPLGETVAIAYLAPFAVMLLGVVLLGEKASAIGWVGASIGFLGVLLIGRPGSGLDPVGVFLCILNAGVSSAYQLLTRVLSHTETTVSLLFNSAWLGAVIFCCLAIPDLPLALPPPADLGLMLLLGALMTLAHFLFTAAYREAPASQLAPITYIHLAWAGGLGWLVFGHLPDGWALIGMAMVTCAGVLVALNSRAQPPKPVVEV